MKKIPKKYRAIREKLMQKLWNQYMYNLPIRKRMPIDWYIKH